MIWNALLTRNWLKGLLHFIIDSINQLHPTAIQNDYERSSWKSQLGLKSWWKRKHYFHPGVFFCSIFLSGCRFICFWLDWTDFYLSKFSITFILPFLHVFLIATSLKCHTSKQYWLQDVGPLRQGPFNLHANWEFSHLALGLLDASGKIMIEISVFVNAQSCFLSELFLQAN